MFNIDLRSFLNQSNIQEKINVYLSQDEKTDEFGIQSDVSSEPIEINGVIVEKLENGFNVATGSYFKKVVYKIYLDRQLYGNIDFYGAEISFRNKRFKVGSYPLYRNYASHFIITVTEDKVV